MTNLIKMYSESVLQLSAYKTLSYHNQPM